MCDICNGKTPEHVTETRRAMRGEGRALQGVEPDRSNRGWVYTIGLLTNYHHPELLIFDDDVRRGAQILKLVRTGDPRRLDHRTR